MVRSIDVQLRGERMPKEVHNVPSHAEHVGANVVRDAVLDHRCVLHHFLFNQG